MPKSGLYHKIALPFAIALCAVAMPAAAQDQAKSQVARLAESTKDNVTPPTMRGEIALKAANASKTTAPESWFQKGDAFTVHNVSKPTLTPFFPPAGKANGTAVVIAPGGGFMMLSMSNEGWDVARWLASQGVTAFVLKYRLLESPPKADDLMIAMVRRISGGIENAGWFEDGTRIATDDAMEAMRVVRANAAKWHIDPKKVGFMGFSAGAFTTLSLVERNDPATMPDFIAPIYGPVGTPAKPLPSALPPMWSMIAADDFLLAKNDFGLLPAWRAKGGSVAFHLHDKGGHGFGFAGTPGTTTVDWPTEFLSWLRARGLAPAPSSK